MNIGDFFKGKDGKNPGAVPAMQQFLGATRGATEALCGVGKHLRSLVAKKAEGGGDGLGFDIGRGFQIGLAVKREAFQHKFRSCFQQAMLKMMIKLGVLPPIPGPLQSGMSIISGTSDANVQALVGGIAQLVSQTTKSASQEPISSTGSKQEATASKGTQDTSLVSSYEKVIGSFLQTPISNDEAEKKVNELQSENNVLQVLLKHQQVLEELMEKNEKIEKVLVEDLNVPAAKLQGSSKGRTKTISHCSDCFECRRRQIKSTK